MIGTSIIFCVAVLVAAVLHIDAGLSGLALSTAMELTSYMNWMVMGPLPQALRLSSTLASTPKSKLNPHPSRKPQAHCSFPRPVGQNQGKVDSGPSPARTLLNDPQRAGRLRLRRAGGLAISHTNFATFSAA